MGFALAWLGCLIAAERQGGHRGLTVAGWVCFACGAAMLALPLWWLGRR